MEEYKLFHLSLIKVVENARPLQRSIEYQFLPFHFLFQVGIWKCEANSQMSDWNGISEYIVRVDDYSNYKQQHLFTLQMWL